MNSTIQDVEKQPRKSVSTQKILTKSATIWFILAVIGQWIFAFYVVLFYGKTTLKGDFAAWNKVLPHGYVPGETVGNIVVGSHLLFAVIMLVGAPLQMMPQIRTRFRKFHYWNGRVYFATAFILSFGGLYMVWTRGVIGGWVANISMTINAGLIILCTLMAWKYAVSRKIKLHQQWAIRLFLVASGVWFFRIGLMAWLIANGSPVGFNPKTLQGPFITVLYLVQNFLPLLIYQLYLYTKRQQNQAISVIAMAMFVLTILVTGLGIFAATMGMWLPRIFS